MKKKTLNSMFPMLYALNHYTCKEMKILHFLGFYESVSIAVEDNLRLWLCCVTMNDFVTVYDLIKYVCKIVHANLSNCVLIGNQE